MKLRNLIGALITACIAIGVVTLFVSAKSDNPVASVEASQIIKSNSVWCDFNQEELFGYADIVVLGKIKEVGSPKETKHNDMPLVYKDYTITIDEVFKGANLPSEVNIRVPGGQIGKKIYISDAAVPDLDKKQIFFLKTHQIGDLQDMSYAILAGPKGKYTIDGDGVKGIDDSKDLKSFKNELRSLKEKFGDKIILPPGVIK